MVGAAAPAAGALAAIPVGLSAIIQMAFGTKIALQGVSDAVGLLAEKQATLARGEEFSAASAEKLEQALSELSPSARKFARRVVGLRGAWTDMRKVVQEPLFEVLAEKIKPVAKTLLPLLQKGLTGTTQALAGVLSKTGDWMQTPLFSRQFSGIMAQNNATIEAGGGALLNFVKGFTFFQRAAAPFQKRMDGVVESVGRWFLLTSRKNARNGDTAAFLDKAGDRLKIVWNITKQLGGGIAGIFRAGDASGLRLLTTFETFLTKWHTWVDSTEGQARLTRWFAGIEGGFIEIARIVNDSFKAMAKWAEDPAIVGMLRTLRTELGPALGDFLETMGKSFGDNVIGLLTELTRALNNAAPAIDVLADVTAGLVGLLGALNDIAEQGGAGTDAIMKLVGALLVLRTGRNLLLGKGGKRGKGGGLLGGLLAGLGLGAGGGKHAKGALGGGLLKKIAGPLAVLGTASFADKTFGDLFKRNYYKGSGLEESVDTFAKNLKTLTTGGVAGANLKIGDTLFGWAPGNTTLEEASTNLKNADATLKEMVQGGAANRAKAHFEAIAAAADKQGVSLAKVTDLFPEYKKALAGLDPKPKKPSALDGILGGASDAGKRVAARAAAELAAFNKQISGLPKQVQTQIKTPGLVDSIEDVDILQGMYRLTPKQVVTTLSASGVVKTMADVREAQRTFDLTPKQVVTLIRTSGTKTTLGDVARLHSQYKLTPKQVVTLLKATGRDFATSEVVALAKQYNLTPRQVLTLLKAKDLASGVASQVKSIYAGIPRVIRTQIIASRTAKNDAALERAGGGSVDGPGTSTSDSILARLSDGEFVVKAKAVKKYGLGLLNRINAMRYAAGGAVSRFAEGGQARRRNRGGDEAILSIKASKRRLKEIGQWVSAAFAEGIRGSAKQIEKAQRQIFKRLTKAGKSKSWIRKFEKHTNREFNKLERLARRKVRLNDRLERTKNRRANLVGQRDSLKESLASSGADYASVTRIGADNQGFLSPSSLIGELRRRVGEARSFRTILAKLRKKGLGKRAYKQLADAGVEEGLPFAQQLLAAGPKQIKQINSLQTQMATASRGLGNDTAKELYQAGINAANGLIRGLNKRRNALNKVARQLARSLVREIRKELRIKSPSKVTEGIGGDTADGLGVGIVKHMKGVTATARRLSQNLARDLTPDMASRQAETLHTSSRKASRVSERTTPQQLAPLVGQLIIQGKTKEEVRDALEEAMFKLRQIRQGGVYASRTA